MQKAIAATQGDIIVASRDAGAQRLDIEERQRDFDLTNNNQDMQDVQALCHLQEETRTLKVKTALLDELSAKVQGLAFSSTSTASFGDANTGIQVGAHHGPLNAQFHLPPSESQIL